MKNLLFLFPLLFISFCNKVDADLCPPFPGFTTYSVAAGHHDFLPNDQVTKTDTPVSNFELMLDSSMWWDFDGDNDYYDISKITGFTDRSNANNKTSAILGWRPYKDHRNQFELFGFVNHSDASFDFKKLGVFDSNTLLSGSIRWIDNKAEFIIVDLELETSFEVTLDVSNEGVENYRGIGGWFGGNDKAPQDMCYWLGFRSNN